MTARPSKIVPRLGVGEPTGERYSREADADGKAWMGLVAALPCVLCTLLGVRQESRTTVHHAREGVGGQQRNSSFQTAALCQFGCHQGPDGVHGTRNLLRLAGVTEQDLVSLTTREVFRKLREKR